MAGLPPRPQICQCHLTELLSVLAEGDVTSNELVMNVRHSGQCSNTAKQPLHIQVCLQGSSARSTGDAWQTTQRPKSDADCGSSDDADVVTSLSLDMYKFYSIATSTKTHCYITISITQS